MFTFKEFITEARMAPLYHGTSIDGLRQIVVRKRGIKPITLQDVKRRNKEVQSGVSLSRSLRFAYNFSANGIVLELDQQRLAQNFKIVPFNFFKIHSARFLTPTWKNEYEEFVLTEKGIPVKYINKIYVDKHYAQVSLKPLFDQIRQEYGSSFITLVDF